jgi:hypothetical protein
MFTLLLRAVLLKDIKTKLTTTWTPDQIAKQKKYVSLDERRPAYSAVVGGPQKTCYKHANMTPDDKNRFLDISKTYRDVFMRLDADERRDFLNMDQVNVDIFVEMKAEEIKAIDSRRAQNEIMLAEHEARMVVLRAKRKKPPKPHGSRQQRSWLSLQYQKCGWERGTVLRPKPKPQPPKQQAEPQSEEGAAEGAAGGGGFTGGVEGGSGSLPAVGAAADSSSAGQGTGGLTAIPDGGTFAWSLGQEEGDPWARSSRAEKDMLRHSLSAGQAALPVQRMREGPGGGRPPWVVWRPNTPISAAVETMHPREKPSPLNRTLEFFDKPTNRVVSRGQQAGTLRSKLDRRGVDFEESTLQPANKTGIKSMLVVTA